MRSLLAPIVILPLVLSVSAHAQSGPSADQIINSLRPTGNLIQGGTRGIRVGAPPAQATAPAATQVAASRPVATQPATQGPSINLTINFENGSAALTPQAIHTLDQLGIALASKDLAEYRFRIEGHTDTVGTRDYNRSLSEKRAMAVVDYVAKKYGVDPTRLQPVGMGEDGLLVPTPDQTAEPRNRRVQVINLGA